ncbi:PLP-dependent aminotransferase family protein [Actinoplanes sp. NPDC051494]|uniref:MocR-like pyridoxine biosynthesis transcription factor PdxR n=1 Tax=Actinoplanes sp. NPDC051494 TaxID=3363907 RepID=UPI00378F19A5
MDFLGTPPVHDRTAWLAESLRGAVADGRLAGDSRLPATRVLAAELGLSRGVVVEAYQRLTDEGLLSGRTGAGTRVTARPTHDPDRPGGVTPEVLRLPQQPHPGIDLDLSPGLPDLSAFPRAAWLRAERAVLGAVTGADLGYGDPRGNPRLRAELAVWLGRHRGLRAGAGDIIVVSGVAQAIALLCQTLRARGVTAWGIEDPGSRGARDELLHWGVQPVAVPVDAEGLRVGELTATDLRVALLTPAHQFPTGVVLSPRRRAELLRWSGLVVEDDYDAEHRYDRAPVAALQASAPERVAYLGSVSKSLAPGMRLGWLVAPRELRDELVAAKHASDLGNPALPQLVLARLLATGDHDRHLRTVRRRQRRHRDALVAALRENLPAARVEGVAAGLHVLVTLPGPADDADLAAEIATAGVRVQPLSWHRQVPGPPGLVLGYAAQPPDRLYEAARRIGRVCR